jgi:uncharacterized membrane protein YphA (DoxX/SURF4 family)
VKLKMKFRDLPGRVSTGSYILHSGLEKWGGDEQRAEIIQGMAAGAFPRLKQIPPAQFLRLLSASEVALGGALLTPFVSSFTAGAALCGFSGSLLAMYWRTESLHKPNSPWPTQGGLAISKDVWMFGIGAGLMLSSLSGGRKKGSKRKHR